MSTDNTEARQDIFFIDDGDQGLLAHSRKSAHQWLDNFLDELKEQREHTTVIFEYRSMTKRQLDKLPSLD